eukprot:6480235-Amphidinium_carterae.1
MKLLLAFGMVTGVTVVTAGAACVIPIVRVGMAAAMGIDVVPMGIPAAPGNVDMAIGMPVVPMGVVPSRPAPYPTMLPSYGLPWQDARCSFKQQLEPLMLMPCPTNEACEAACKLIGVHQQARLGVFCRADMCALLPTENTLVAHSSLHLLSDTCNI